MPNPVRGGLCIDPADTYSPNPFCFSAARRRAVRYSCTQDCRRAAEKQKGEYYSRIVSINRSPLTGFQHETIVDTFVGLALFDKVFDKGCDKVCDEGPGSHAFGPSSM
jgi:hypothetical protein